MAIMILAFSMRFGELTAMVFSRMKPGEWMAEASQQRFPRQTDGTGQERTLVEVRVRQLAANLLDDLNVLEVRRSLGRRKKKEEGDSGSETRVKREARPRDATSRDNARKTTHLEPEDGVDGEVSKVVLVLRKDLGRERCPGDVDEVGPEGDRVRAGVVPEFGEGRRASQQTCIWVIKTTTQLDAGQGARC